MLKLILAFNFTEDRFKALRLVGMMCKAQTKPVAKKDFNQQLGYLAGLPELVAQEGAYEGTESLSEMVYLCGFTRTDLDKLLMGIKRSRLGSIKLKSMMTPTNITWTPLQLLRELSQEHAYMTKKGQPKPEHQK